MVSIFYSSIMDNSYYYYKANCYYKGYENGGGEWVLLLAGVNHSADKRQETGTPRYPPPPPLGVVFLPLVTTGGRGWVSVTTGLLDILC